LEDIVSAFIFMGKAILFTFHGGLPHVWYHRHDYTAPATCPDCGHTVYDHRFDNDNREALGKKRKPDFVCAAHCGWVLKALTDQDDKWF
jgi:hypothetical protein